MKLRLLAKKCHRAWSKRIRERDGYYCQWCLMNGVDLKGHKPEPSKYNHAHHIVATSLCNRYGRYDLLNGMTLCFKHHIEYIKSRCEEYMAFRNAWLDERDMNYIDLRKSYENRTIKFREDDYVAKLEELLAQEERGE